MLHMNDDIDIIRYPLALTYSIDGHSVYIRIYRTSAGHDGTTVPRGA